MTLQIPALLMLLGTALLAIVIFAPRRPARAAATVSYAPPIAPPPVERWSPPHTDDGVFAPDLFFEPPARTVTWPELVDPAALGAPGQTRANVVEALGALRTPWALAVLERARDEESEPLVRAALDAAAISGRTGR